MKTISRRGAFAALGAASALVATAAIPAVAVATESDAELFAAHSEFDEARDAWDLAFAALDRAKRDAVAAYPDTPAALWFLGKDNGRLYRVMWPNRALGYLVDNHCRHLSKKRLAGIWEKFDRFEATCQPINEAHDLPRLKEANESAAADDARALDRFVATPARTFEGLLEKAKWMVGYTDWLGPDMDMLESLLGKQVHSGPKFAESLMRDLERLAGRAHS